jgi:hypothetical protein
MRQLFADREPHADTGMCKSLRLWAWPYGCSSGFASSAPPLQFIWWLRTGLLYRIRSVCCRVGNRRRTCSDSLPTNGIRSSFFSDGSKWNDTDHCIGDSFELEIPLLERWQSTCPVILKSGGLVWYTDGPVGTCIWGWDLGGGAVLSYVEGICR